MITVTLKARRHSVGVTLSARRHAITVTTAFTTNAEAPTSRIFNSRFSDRFKKS